MASKPVYRRVLLKLSGEALQGSKALGIDSEKLTWVSDEIKSIVNLGVQVAIVIGAGNFLMRGAEFSVSGVDRVTADQMGMLATAINGLALNDALQKKSIPTKMLSAIAMPSLADIYDRQVAKKCLEQGQVVILLGGTGNPLVTTDSAAALRGIEINADIVLKATKVEGVFAADPMKNPKAERYDSLTYDEILEQRLGVMDLNAILLCRDNALALRVFNMNKQGALHGIVLGENIGTLIKGVE